MKKLPIYVNTQAIIKTLNELLEELAKKGIIELEDDNNGGSED